jgi:predicted nucleic acid-binding protein
LAAVTHLLDKSAWVQAQYSRDAARRIADLIRRGDLSLCTITVLEILYSARNSSEYDQDYARLSTMPWCDLANPRRAATLQHELARRGWHRTPLPDVIIAATAAEHGLTVLHYDSDFERLSEVCGAGHEWVIARASGHGSASTPAT